MYARILVPGATLALGLAAGAVGVTVAQGSTRPPAQGSTQAPASSAPVYLAASLLGRNEIPGDKGPVGDPSGRAVEFLKISGNRLSYAIRWQGIGIPTEAHIHLGAVGVNGPVKIELPVAASGTVTVNDPAVLTGLRSDPTGFYANLHTARFPGGAVRGQLHRITSWPQISRVFTASVLDGVQIYACTKQADGTYAFTQHDVRARLRYGIRHSFVTPDAGPPQWVAPDGSAVTGKVLTKTPHGTGNIPELELAATPSGTGLLSRVSEVLRLNTVGGVAPSGACDPAARPTAEVPYRADYLFLS